MENLIMSYRDGVIGMLSLLPFELCIHILSLLPVKSLLVLRAVCKWLASVVDDDEFASFHLHHLPDNVLRNRFFDVRIRNVDPSEKLNDAVAYMVSSSTHHPVYIDHVHDIERQHWPVECSLDGLVLLVGRTRTRDRVVLWNPSIRRHRRLPTLAKPGLEYALGHHASCNEYKVVAVSCDNNEDVAWVYSTKLGSWTSIHDRGNACARRHSQPLPFKDGVAWLQEADSNNEGLSCVWLDLGTERFCRANEGLAGVKQDLCGLVALDGGSTAGLWGYDVEGHPSIWVLQTHTKSWVKQHKIVSPEWMQLRIEPKGLYNRNVVKRVVWEGSKTKDAEAVEHGSLPIKGVYIESLYMLH